MKKLLILIVILILCAIGGVLYMREGQLPVNKKSTESTFFVIKPGQDLDSIINDLSDAKLIRNRVVFYLVVKQLGIERKIQAGDFRLSQSMTAQEIAEEFTHGTVDVWITIPEGLRKEEIAERMATQFNIPETEFNELANEGSLFPDTYLVPKNPTAQQIIDIMTANFEKQFTDELRAKAREKGFTENELITFASIIEKEAFRNDKQEVADIMYRRLQDDYPLQVDATVQYALGYQASERRWWKKQTTFDDLKYVSPYNTYLNTGLPPAPISNPGRASLEAAANADAATPYMFYLHDSKGNTYYAETYEEHQANIQKYLR
ncbi:endolytic transglycosylase MltG [Candidatus Woesebacteria bacterium]|nr:endolytic transglycosylase MltG [Candidatus Woesebacteria bacterium]